MNKFDSITDTMTPLKRGLLGFGKAGLALHDHTFEKTVFGFFQDGAPRGQRYLLKNVTFDRCTVEIGPMRFSHGWELEDVIINKMKAWRLMIDAETPMRNVTMSSYAKVGRLEILPSIATEGLKSRQFDTDGFQIDVSGYKGDLRIMGIDAGGVRIDPDRQFRLRLPQRNTKPSMFEDLDQSSLMALRIGSMSSWRVRDTVGSLPAKNQKEYETERKALDVLYDLGVAF